MEHNFRYSAWGHASFLKQDPFNAEVYTGLVISTPSPSIGDTIVWRTAYGECVAEVEFVKYMRDPADMSDVRAKIVERRVSEEALAQIDEHGEPPWEYTLLKETK